MSRILGVNIGAGALHASVIEKKLGSIRHIRTVEAVLPDNKDERDKVIIEAIAQWKKDFSPDGLVIGLPLQHFSCTVITMPVMNRDDMKKALVFELEKHLPLTIEEYVFDFLTIQRKTESSVLVFSIKRDIISNLMRMAKEGGLEVLSIRCSTIDAVWSVLNISGERLMGGLVINSTGDAYEIAGIDQSVPVYAKRYPKNADILAEIERLAALYPGKLYFNGVEEPAIVEKLSGTKLQISIPDSVANAFVKKTKLNLDFIPEEFIKPREDYYPYLIGGFAAGAVLLFLLTGALIYIKNSRTLSGFETRISAIKSKASGAIEENRKLESLRSERNLLVEFQNRSNLSIRIVGDLSKIVPNDVWLINLSIDDKGVIEIEGFSRKTSDLIVMLEKSKKFKNISFSAPITSRDGEERFSLKMEAIQP